MTIKHFLSKKFKFFFKILFPNCLVYIFYKKDFSIFWFYLHDIIGGMVRRHTFSAHCIYYIYMYLFTHIYTHTYTHTYTYNPFVTKRFLFTIITVLKKRRIRKKS
jgi:hypothetical protein